MSSYTFEELIESVQKRPEIWQLSHPRFCNQSRRDGWVQVSKELKTHEIRLRKSWKYLVDQFRKELKPKNQTRGSTPSVWAYYNKMCFMKDEITNRQGRRKIRARTNSDSPSNDSNHESNVRMTHDSTPSVTQNLLEEDSENSNNKHTDVTSSYNPNPQAKPMIRYSSIGASTVIKEQVQNMTLNTATQFKVTPLQLKHRTTKADLILRRLENLRTEMNDDDHMFFMSILPMVKNLPPLKKLQLRGKINEWLLQMLSDYESADPLNSVDNNVEDIFGDNEWSEATEDNKEAVLSQLMEAEDDQYKGIRNV